MTHICRRFQCELAENRATNSQTYAARAFSSDDSRHKMPVNCTTNNKQEYFLGLEQYWHWVIGYWAIFADIG